jgi:transcriptional regulator with XRE-family HTH domain|nr:MAG TPA: Cro/C1-type HTH DNA-binding domain protein [Caudoviricetes sp.]
MQGFFKRSRNFGATHNLRSGIMANLYNNIENLCKKRGVNVTTMCRDSGASRGSLSDLKSGRKQTLKYETLEKIANYFEISVESLVSGNESQKEKLAPGGSELDARFDALLSQMTDADRSDLLEYMEFKVAKRKENPNG